MRVTLRRVPLFVLYQLSLLAGIMLLPIALALRPVGVTLPVHRLINWLGAAYDGDDSHDGTPV